MHVPQVVASVEVIIMPVPEDIYISRYDNSFTSATDDVNDSFLHNNLFEKYICRNFLGSKSHAFRDCFGNGESGSKEIRGIQSSRER